MLLLATHRIVLVVSRCCHLLWLSSACWYGDLILVESREVAYRRFGWLPCYHKKLKCQEGKAKSQRDRLTLHQPIRLRPQRCIQRCISQKAYNFLGAVPPHPTTAQHTGPNTHSNTQHTHARIGIRIARTEKTKSIRFRAKMQS